MSSKGKLTAMERKRADARHLSDVLRAMVRAHGAPINISAAELARRATDATTTYTAMRVGNAAPFIVQFLRARDWRLSYEEVTDITRAVHPVHLFSIQREGR